jgi:NAD(P)H-dependent FMN reductase
MERLAGLIRPADAVCVVSAEYNHGVPPALKNMLDHFLEEWFHKPAGVCCYSTGRFGGVRAAMQLRMILPELGMPTISSLLPVPHVARAVPLDGEPESWVIPAADRFLRELMWWAAAARDRRATEGSPFGGWEVSSFDTLSRRVSPT